MGLLNDILQQNQQTIAPKKTLFDAYNQVIAPKEMAGMETRTPAQIAYDNLLNREAEINKQNKTNNFVSGLMSGIGGLGKVIANSVVSNPYQKAGAMEGIGEQETRLDGLQQAYNQARQQQNKDFVNQAREQLGLAREDEDKDYRRSEADKIFNYNQEKDLFNQKFLRDKFEFEKDNANKAYEMKIAELNNAKENAKSQAEKEAIELDIKKENLNKLKRENSPEYIEEQKNKEQYEKDLAEVNKLIEKGNFNAEDRVFLLTHPEAYREIDSRVIFSPFRGKFKIPSEVKAKYEKADREKMGDTYGIFNMNEDLTLGEK